MPFKEGGAAPELVRLATGEYYIADCGTDGRPASAGGPVPNGVLEMLMGTDEDEDIVKRYFCSYPPKDPEAVAFAWKRRNRRSDGPGKG